MTDIHGGFGDAHAPAVADVGALVEFLTLVGRLPTVREYQRRMLELCPPAPGQRILDVGCGIGLSTLELARLAGDTATVVGVDRNEAFILEARSRATRAGANVEFRVTDARALTLEARSFNVCRAERVLMYVDQPERVIDEMVRVARPGGRLLFFEFDYDGVIVDAPDREFTRRVAQLVADSVPSPWIGRQLARLLRDRGVRGVQVMPHMVITPLPVFERVARTVVSRGVRDGTLPAQIADAWWSELRRADAGDCFFAGFHGFLVAGLTPWRG